MKKFKISFAALLAIFIGIAASSFTVKSTVRTEGQHWYLLTEFEDPAIAASYYEDMSSGPECAGEPGPVCAIRANESTTTLGQPDETELSAIVDDSESFSEPADNLKYKDQ